jgi:hypothetical protein
MKMTTAYTAEIDTRDGTRYLAPKSKLSKVPFFFRTVSHMRRSLAGARWRTGSDYYVPTRDELKTVIVKVDHLERGLRASFGTKLSVRDFMALPTSTKSPSVPSNAIFKVQLNAAGTGVGPNKKRFAGPGKLGKTWARQGDLRSHITLNIHWLTTIYKDAVVVQALLNPDGVSVSSITYTPIIEWYRRSQYGNRTYLKNFGESMSSNDLSTLTPRSEYA